MAARAARRRRACACAATRRPLSRASAEVALDDLLLARRDQRADVEVGAAPGRRAARGSARPCARTTSSKTRALDQDARRRRAGLPGVLDAGVDEEGQRRVEVGIGEDDLRALAAELERHRHGVLRRRGLHQRADRDRAGEREVVRRRDAPASAAPASSPRPGTTLSAPAGKPASLRDAREGERGQAGLFGRLEHAGVAHRQRRADAAADDLHRVVPRHDVAGDAVRLAQRQRGVAVGEGDGLAHHLVGRAAVELEVARQRQRVGAALLQRLADVQRFEPRQLVGLLQHRAADMRSSKRPRSAAREAAPGAVERGLRRVPPRRRCRPALPRAICASALPSDGLTSGSVSPLRAARQWPPMNTRCGRRECVAGEACDGSCMRMAAPACRARRLMRHHRRPRRARRGHRHHALFLLKRFATFVATLARGVGGGVRGARRAARQRRRR